ncbi:MAG: hypothetical protein JEY96_00290 [Bacteroidales bacterium]|nr:hypothetical protein [Bacteroidales bacterium]
MIDIKKHSLYKTLEFDSSLSSIFTIYLKKFWPLFIFSFLGIFIIQMIMYQLGFFELYSISDPNEILRVFSTLMNKIVILSVTSVVVYGVLNTFLINYLLKSDFEPQVNFGDLLIESIKKYALHMIFFLILSMLMVLVGMFLGVIVFVVGLFAAVLYLGTVLITGGTIIVAEEKNAIDTVGRAFLLTHKDFWNALGIFVVFILIIMLASLIVSAIVAIPFVIMFFDNLSETGNILEAFNFHSYDLGIWLVVTNSIVAAIVYPLYSILSVVLYFKLKFVEDQKGLN